MSRYTEIQQEGIVEKFTCGDISYAELARQYGGWHTDIKRLLASKGVDLSTHYRSVSTKDCAIDIESGTKECTECLRRLPVSMYRRQLNKSNGISGKCVDCISVQERERGTGRKSLGLCIKCQRELNPFSSDLCDAHLVRQLGKGAMGRCDMKTAAVLAEKLKRQNFTCLYPGDRLDLGRNASLDHEKPVSRFPELKADIDNLNWVTLEVNLAKRDLTLAEFESLCSKVSSLASVESPSSTSCNGMKQLGALKRKKPPDAIATGA